MGVIVRYLDDWSYLGVGGGGRLEDWVAGWLVQLGSSDRL